MQYPLISEYLAAIQDAHDNLDKLNHLVPVLDKHGEDRKPTFVPLAKARKRIETLFSQLTDQFLVIRNYAKITNGLFARIIGKISALTILQYVNFINNRPIGRIKYALN